MNKETKEIIADKEAMEAIAEGLQDLTNGELVSLEKQEEGTEQ